MMAELPDLDPIEGERYVCFLRTGSVPIMLLFVSFGSKEMLSILDDRRRN